MLLILDTGGIDTGAINSSLGLYERNQVWKISSYLKEYLEEYQDTSVYLTCPTLRTSGEVIPRETRADIMKSYNADLAISIHIDSSTSSSLNGATAYVSALPKYNSSMTNLGNKLLANLNKLGIKNNGVKTRKTESNDGYYSDGTPLDYYGIIRYPTLHNIPIVLLEHCYISNANDCKYIDSDDDLKKLAKSDADAIVSYLNLTKKTEETKETEIKAELTQEDKIEGVTFSDITISKGYITNILAGTTISSIKSKIETDYTIKITDKNDKELEDSVIIPNCAKLIISNQDKTIATYMFTIYGDINCNGEINSIDLLVLQRHILGIKEISSHELKAGNISKDGTNPTSIDLLKIQRHILGISQIK